MQVLACKYRGFQRYAEGYVETRVRFPLSAVASAKADSPAPTSRFTNKIRQSIEIQGAYSDNGHWPGFQLLRWSGQPRIRKNSIASASERKNVLSGWMSVKWPQPCKPVHPQSPPRRLESIGRGL